MDRKATAGNQIGKVLTERADVAMIQNVRARFHVRVASALHHMIQCVTRDLVSSLKN